MKIPCDGCKRIFDENEITMITKRGTVVYDSASVETYSERKVGTAYYFCPSCYMKTSHYITKRDDVELHELKNNIKTIIGADDLEYVQYRYEAPLSKKTKVVMTTTFNFEDRCLIYMYIRAECCHILKRHRTVELLRLKTEILDVFHWKPTSSSDFDYTFFYIPVSFKDVETRETVFKNTYPNYNVVGKPEDIVSYAKTLSDKYGDWTFGAKKHIVVAGQRF